MSTRYVHLHVHSEYSLSDSTIRIPGLVQACARAGMGAVAVTDDSNLFALVKFYRAAEAAGVKPIAGADVWIRDPEGEPFRVTLLCQNLAGYRNLAVLMSAAYRERKQLDRVSLERGWLDERHEGLIVLLGGDSDLARNALGGREPQARAALARWQRRFGDRCYVELTRLGHPERDAYAPIARELAALADCPAIASNDARFLERADFDAHEARVCIHDGHVLGDAKRPRRYTDQQYLKSPDEMAALFADAPEALANTVELAKRCNLELSFGKYVLPAFPTPAGETEPEHLARRSREGLVERLAARGLAHAFTRTDYDERLERELGVIVKMGFPGYFLIVADFIGWARANDIPVGPGRGSGAGSLVAYVLGITDLDPLRDDLLFERFLNPERVSMPDFDIDFCMDRRDEVIEYVSQRYGRERVSQIITYGTMAAKAVLRDTGRVLGMPYGQVDRIAKLIPPRPIDLTLEDALGRSEQARIEPERVSAEFRQAYESDDEVRSLVDLALKLEDLTRNAGKHAGGVVIAPSDLTDFTPLYAEARSDALVTQFDKDDVEAVGLVKFDFLGLRTLTIIDWAVKAINRRRALAGEPPIDIAKLPLDDAPSYALLKRCDTTAIFQLESRGMRDLVRKLQPDNFDDIVALVALFRPGPLQSGMVDDFIDRKHGRATVHYPHPSLEPILRPTYGVIVYQEQVMQIAQVLAGYSLGGADLLRRAMGKKKPEEMAKERVKFETGAGERGVEAGLASSIFDLMEKFAEYGFNKSHSAAYALVAYQTAWLKAHYPSEFMAAVLSADMDKTEKVVHFLFDARAQGLEVLKPCVNQGGYPFLALPDGRIQYGLGAIKGVGRAAIESIVAERVAHGPYADLADLTQRVEPGKLGKRMLEALTQSGALDALGPNRASLWHGLPEAMKAAEQRVRNLAAGQNDMFGCAVPDRVPVQLPVVPDWPIGQTLSGERDTLGHYLSGHPMDEHQALLSALVSTRIGEADSLARAPVPGQEWRRNDGPSSVLAGVVAEVRRRGDQMAFAMLEDATGRIEAGFFRDAMQAYAPLLVKDTVLVVEGTVQSDEVAGTLTLRARQAYTLDQALERSARVLVVRVVRPDASFSQRLSQVLAGHRPGRTPVRLVYRSEHSETQLELGAGWQVRASSALLAAVRALTGVDSADLLLGRLPSAPPSPARSSRQQEMA